MRRLPFVLSALLAFTGLAHADLTSRALSAVDDPNAGAGSPQANMLTWAGNIEQTSLPDLLQLAVRLAPTLMNAKLDIEIAEAQIEQTWARRDWHFAAQASGSWTGSGLVAGVAIGSNKRFGITGDIFRTFSTGGTYGLHASTQWSKTTA